MQLRYWIELRGSFSFINGDTILGNSGHKGQCAQNWQTLSQSAKEKTTKVSTRTKNDSLIFCIWYIHGHIIMKLNQVSRPTCWWKWVGGSMSVYTGCFFSTVPPNFQYQIVKRWTANQRFCSMKFSMYKRSSLVEQRFSF